MEIKDYTNYGIGKWLEKDTSLLGKVEDIQFYQAVGVDSETGESITKQVSSGLITINTDKLSDADIRQLLGNIRVTSLTSGDISQPINVISGYLQSANFTTGTTGWRIDGDGDLEANSGTFRGDLIAGSIHIPDENTTANSFHVESDGDTFWGCTQSDFTANNDNANAYILKTGVAKFQSISIVGGVIDSTSTLGGRLGSTLASAIDSYGHFLDANLDTSAKEILGDFTFGASGAIKMITDENNGLWISPTGILGKKAGVNTLTIGIDGDAKFAGTLEAAGGTLGTITAGLLAGITIAIGTSNNIFKADSNGIYLGNATFASAPFRVSMAGALIATSATITGSITATSGIIGGWTVNGSELYGGNISLDAGDEQIRINSTGYQGGGIFLGKSTGAYKFSVGSSSGNYISYDATTFIIQGGTIRTGSTGNRIVITDNTLESYDSDNVRRFLLDENEVYFFNAAGSAMGVLYSGTTYLNIEIISGYGIGIYNDSSVIPLTNNAGDLGSTLRKWKDLYIAGTSYLTGKVQLPVGTDLY